MTAARDMQYPPLLEAEAEGELAAEPGVLEGTVPEGVLEGVPADRGASRGYRRVRSWCRREASYGRSAATGETARLGETARPTHPP